MKTYRRLAPPIALCLALLVLWEAATVFLSIQPLILPRLSAVIAVLVEEAPLFLRHGIVTTTAVLAGFLLATVIGALCGTIIALSPVVGSAIYPTVIAAQLVPKVAVAPLLIIWLGFGISPKVVLTGLIAFFPIVINTVVGLNMTRRDDIYLFRSMGADAVQTFVKLRLPNALPVFFGGLKVASTLAVIGAVVGEFTGAQAGLGYLITVQVGSAETAGAFASILCLTLLGLIVFFLVAAVERLLIPRHMLRRIEEVSVSQQA